VLTKPELIQPGGHKEWLKVFRNKDSETDYPLRLGYYVTRQPSTKQATQGMTWEAARKQERTYLADDEIWKHEDAKRKGTEKLISALSSHLATMIRYRFDSL
jgi:hypothetical protein